MSKSALLVLADGTVFYGRSIGAIGLSVGEVVFNTSMTGYQEILTDPSYFHQIVALTYPHIGNIGINIFDKESDKIYVRGLVVRNNSMIDSNFRSEESLSNYLKRNSIVAIDGIDTRKLTRLLRETGVQNGCINAIDNNPTISLAIQKLKEFPGLKGIDLAKEVSTTKKYTWKQGSYNLKNKFSKKNKIEKLFYHVVVYDYGIKQNILRMLVDRGCSLTIVPARTSAIDVLKLNPDGIFLSNGPGDPQACHYAIKTIRYLLNINIPIFGICLGYQLLALASGAKTIKMTLGHHGINHPVKNLDSNIVMITTQNHGFIVNSNQLPNNLRITHISLFDKTIQGIHRIDKPAFGFQGHPEASPGPHDSASLFDHFIELIKEFLINRINKDQSCQNVQI